MQRSFILTVCFLAAAVVGRAQDPYIISGKIYDSSAHALLASASVRIKGTSIGTVSAEDGSFHLKTNLKPPLTLVVTSVGYKAQEFEVTQNEGVSISLNTRTVLVDQVVVTASRVSRASCAVPLPSKSWMSSRSGPAPRPPSMTR
jgi:hypothetical protein